MRGSKEQEFQVIPNKKSIKSCRRFSVGYRTGVPNLGYMYPQGYISLSEEVHLGLAIEEKSIFICYLFLNIYTYINKYYFQKPLYAHC